MWRGWHHGPPTHTGWGRGPEWRSPSHSQDMTGGGGASTAARPLAAGRSVHLDQGPPSQPAPRAAAAAAIWGRGCDHFGLTGHLSPCLGVNYVLIRPLSLGPDILGRLGVTQEDPSAPRPWGVAAGRKGSLGFGSTSVWEGAERTLDSQSCSQREQLSQPQTEAGRAPTAGECEDEGVGGGVGDGGAWDPGVFPSPLTQCWD